jgi:hypothetical protein
MDQAEVELGLGVQAELPQRRVVRLVEALARDGQVDPVEGAPQARRQRVGDVDQFSCIGGLLEMTVLDVTVAEVVAKLDVRRHVAGEPKQPLQDPALDVVEPDREDALEHPEFKVRVPLDGELIVGHVLEDRP